MFMYHTQSPFILRSQIQPNTKKTVIDAAVNRYYAIQLDIEGQPITTFITEWGRYIYLYLPHGFLASGIAYTSRYNKLIKEVPRKLKIVDNTLLYDTFFHTWAKNGIVINAKKFNFCKDTVDFAGFTITPTFLAPSTKILNAIQDFSVPINITGGRSWFELVNQIAWAYSISPIMEPFHNLVKPNCHFQAETYCNGQGLYSHL